jgi:two-component system response regulator HydG
MSEALSILVVDDNPSMASILADILDVKGFTVHAANSGAEALEILRNHPVDILLTDVKMPGMNGVELYRETRKTHPNLLTFLMTAYSEDEIIQKGMAEGIKVVFSKPVDINLLVSIFSACKRINTKAG